ncbi:MAG: pectate lyase family protein [Paludibacter sp.]
MKTKITFISLLCLLFFVQSLFAVDTTTMVGWATCYNNGQGVTGGGTFSLNAANAVVVKTEAEFYTAIGKNDVTPKIIILDGIINRAKSSDFMLQGLKNKTIFGMPGARIITATSDIYGFLFRDCENIIVRNITFEGKGSTTNQKGDLICTENTLGVWIDHCTFIDGGDGNVDITKGSDLVSVTYCKFYYTSLSGHTYACLIGSSDNDADTDQGKLRCTFQYVWWTEGCVERMPRVRFGKVHVVNNLFDSKDALYCIRAGYMANLHIEKNSFLNVKQPVAGQFEDYDPTSPYYCTFTPDNKTVGTELGDTQAKIENDLFGVWAGPSWIPSAEPNYKMNNSIVSAELSEKIIRTECGPTLKLNTDGTVAKAEALYVIADNSTQSVIQGKPITNITFKASNDAAVLVVDGTLPTGLIQTGSGNQITISGTINAVGTYTIKVKGSCTVAGNLLEGETTSTIIVSDPNQLVMSEVSISGVPVTLTNNEGTVQFSKTADITKLKVIFKIPETILSDFVSGSTCDFSQGPLKIKLTAPDNSSATVTLAVTKNPTYKVLYLIQLSKYTFSTTDKLYNMLSGKYEIERRDAEAAARDFSYYKDFDLVVMQESLEGKTCTGTAELYQLHTAIDMPVLSTKSFFYSTGRLGWGTPAQAGTIKDIIVPEAVRTHPIFEGVTLTNGLLTGITSQPITLNAAYTGTKLGEADNASNVKATSIHELSAEQRYGAGSSKKSKYLLISMMNADFPALTDNTLKLLDNACTYLMTPSISTGISSVVSKTLQFDGNKVINPAGKALQLFNTAGCLLLSSTKDIELTNFSKGIYIVRSVDGEIIKLMK